MTFQGLGCIVSNQDLRAVFLKQRANAGYVSLIALGIGDVIGDDYINGQ